MREPARPVWAAKTPTAAPVPTITGRGAPSAAAAALWALFAVEVVLPLLLLLMLLPPPPPPLLLLPPPLLPPPLLLLVQRRCGRATVRELAHASCRPRRSHMCIWLRGGRLRLMPPA